MIRFFLYERGFIINKNLHLQLSNGYICPGGGRWDVVCLMVFIIWKHIRSRKSESEFRSAMLSLGVESGSGLWKGTHVLSDGLNNQDKLFTQLYL